MTGNLPKIKKLLLEVDRVDTFVNLCQDGKSPLYFACWKGSVEMVNFFVNEGADINHQDQVRINSNPNSTTLSWVVRTNCAS